MTSFAHAAFNRGSRKSTMSLGRTSTKNRTCWYSIHTVCSCDNEEKVHDDVRATVWADTEIPKATLAITESKCPSATAVVVVTSNLWSHGELLPPSSIVSSAFIVRPSSVLNGSVPCCLACSFFFLLALFALPTIKHETERREWEERRQQKTVMFLNAHTVTLSVAVINPQSE